MNDILKEMQPLFDEVAKMKKQREEQKRKEKAKNECSNINRKLN